MTHAHTHRYSSTAGFVARITGLTFAHAILPVLHVREFEERTSPISDAIAMTEYVPFLMQSHGSDVYIKFGTSGRASVPRSCLE